MSSELYPFAVGFGLALLRTSMIVAFVPIPGWRRAPYLTKATLAAALAVTATTSMPDQRQLPQDASEFAIAAVSELGLGVLFGVVTALAVEAFSLGAQLLGVQAGFSYASTIDPSTEADSGVLAVIAQLIAGLLFFAMQLDLFVLRALLRSFALYPPGHWTPQLFHNDFLLRLGTELFATALRFAFPVIALLLMLDLAVAILGRLQANLQLLTLSFPAKLVLTLGLLALLAPASPLLLRRHIEGMTALWPK